LLGRFNTLFAIFFLLFAKWLIAKKDVAAIVNAKLKPPILSLFTHKLKLEINNPVL
jgi:hypothetical protein